MRTRLPPQDETEAPGEWLDDGLLYLPAYAETDPLSGAHWPSMPQAFLGLARRAAALADFPAYAPDVCLINRYAPGSRLGVHRDQDEIDFSQPIVSVSLGLPAIYKLYGHKRGGRGHDLPLADGDVLVLGGPARRRYHAVAGIREGHHPLTGRYRYNLTFRRAR